MNADLEAAREEIRTLDEELVRLIGRRVELARGVGKAKRAEGVPTLDPSREAAVVRHAASVGREAGLPDEEVRQIFWLLIGVCRRAQEEGDGS